MISAARNKYLQTGLELIKIGWPIMLSSTGFMLMQLTDAFFLGHYSSTAIAAIGPAGMAVYLTAAFFQGTIGYTGTLVAHNYGAKRFAQMSRVAWQGIYLSIIFALSIAICSPFLVKMFRLFGHSGEMLALEESYYSIMLGVIICSMIGGAAGQFFIGQGKTKAVMCFQLCGQVINGILDYILIFGHFGLPALGICGAAYASVIGATFTTTGILFLFWSPKIRREYNTWQARGFDKEHFRTLIYYGAHTGVRFFVDALIWSGFMLFVGRLGTNETAATSIAFRLNYIILFPLFGLAEAVRIKVGQAKGARNNTKVRETTWVGLCVAEFVMLCGVAIYLLFPREMYLLFAPDDSAMMQNYLIIMDVGKILLYYVAFYCLFDGLNLIFSTALQGVGDTRWVMNATVISHVIFFLLLLFVDRVYPNLYVEWGVITIFVLILGLIWCSRFLSGKWEKFDLLAHLATQTEK